MYSAASRGIHPSAPFVNTLLVPSDIHTVRFTKAQRHFEQLSRNAEYRRKRKRISWTPLRVEISPICLSRGKCHRIQGEGRETHPSICVGVCMFCVWLLCLIVGILHRSPHHSPRNPPHTHIMNTAAAAYARQRERVCYTGKAWRFKCAHLSGARNTRTICLCLYTFASTLVDICVDAHAQYAIYESTHHTRTPVYTAH